MVNPETAQHLAAAASAATVATAILAALTLWQARKIFDKQQKLADKIHEEQRTFAQRQLFVPIFQQFKGLANLNCSATDDANIRNVTNTINFIEFLGVCYEGQIVVTKILFRVFGEFVVQQYEALCNCTDSPSGQATSWSETIQESKSATALYHDLLKSRKAESTF